MDENDRRPWPGGTGVLPRPASAGHEAGALDARLAALPPASVVERRPIVRLAPGGEVTVAAERLVVSQSKLAAALAANDDDLLRHAADRVAARLAGSPAAGLPARLPLLLPLPLRPFPPPAPRPGLIGVLPVAAVAMTGPSLAERRARLGVLGWRLGIAGLDAAALRFVAVAALGAELLLVRWSPALGRLGDALRGADPQAVVLTGCDGPDALRWGRGAGLTLFGGPAAEAMLPSGSLEARP